MLDQRGSTESEAHAYLDRAVLGLMLAREFRRRYGVSPTVFRASCAI